MTATEKKPLRWCLKKLNKKKRNVFYFISSFRYLTTNKSVDYTNWYSIDQPNNGDGAGEHCVISVPDGMYNADELVKCSRMLKINQ